MKVQTTLVRTFALTLLAVAVGSTLWSCGGRTPSAPSAPSAVPPAPESSVASVPTTIITVSWECVTARRAGIFSASGGSCTPGTVFAARTGAAALLTPSAPSNFGASASGSTVSLSWTAPATGDATSYVLEAGSIPGASDLASFDTGNTATALSVPGVPAGTYFVRVRGRNAAGTSGASNEVALTVGSAAPCAGPPSAPTGLNAAVNGSSVTLTWNASNGGCAPTSYVLEAGSSPGSNNLANVATGSTATSFSTSGVGAGTYYVRARASNAAGVSGVSNEVIVVISGQRECSQRVGPFATQDTAFRRRQDAASLGYNVSGVFPCFDESGTRGYCFNVFFRC